MVRQRKGIPVARLHKPSGLARIRLDGREIYLGRWGSPEAKEKADQVFAAWLANNRRVISPKEDTVYVADVLTAFWRYAVLYYRHPDGASTGEAENFKEAIRPVRKCYARTPARDFGPAELETVREELVRSKLARSTIKARVNRIRRIWKWAVRKGLVPVECYQALMTVEGLRAGRALAPEGRGVVPVRTEDVAAAIPFMPPAIAAMVSVQLLSGCRAGDVLIIRPCDIDRSEATWIYTPGRHKNSWRGQKRTIPLGPKAQEVLTPWLVGKSPEQYLFSPRDTEGGKHARRTASRKSKPTPSELSRRVESPGSRRRSRYDRRTYRQAVVRACDRAGVPTWSPLQLRHTRATELRKMFGLEGAQAVLGHARVETTQIYAERSEEKAKEIARLVG